MECTLSSKAVWNGGLKEPRSNQECSLNIGRQDQNCLKPGAKYLLGFATIGDPMWQLSQQGKTNNTPSIGSKGYYTSPGISSPWSSYPPHNRCFTMGSQSVLEQERITGIYVYMICKLLFSSERWHLHFEKEPGTLNISASKWDEFGNTVCSQTV